ncbi:uncharacterized protein LOC113849949 [Abrus precatorius]|uniref:Uncharacterized protein LOC113849949 n=1 Tax=Abrus precatorius TaxID=3816 RepID=A0A8B8JZ99_ABRPR|nr:uncharacterized protein LOC113849949 [Abrus precatorius]XP_027336020.1 uncharacterized protein LOC113849949 [Abrus precatorius]XP_027336021.1 uncharacterized protein LOC113849949 [Abrus precatorius]XP_027336022.1 uncharacterized protein LOC113849949 [Abrus precatorius]XP_027336023.1 uncharacterized protein LOC113849949 [Abrus precatorius]
MRSGEIASSFSLVWLKCFKHKNSCYRGASVTFTCISNKRNFSNNDYLPIIRESNTSSHAPNNRSRESGSLGGMLKYKSVENYPVLRASCLQHWFKNWQTLRRNKLTASTFAAAIGFWRQRRVQLWLEKLGAIEPFSGNLATCWSNIKEGDALERYKLITGNTVLFPQFQVYDAHPEDNWLAASPDGVINGMVYELPSRGVLEIKCPYFDGDIRRAFPWSRIPIHYIPQAQGLMEILGRDWMDFYVWTPNGSSLFRLYRDLEYWDVMKIALSDFWWKHVQPARELYCSNEITNPLFELRSLRPARRHELCTYIVYKSKHIVDNSKLLMREIHGKLRIDVSSC